MDSFAAASLRSEYKPDSEFRKMLFQSGTCTIGNQTRRDFRPVRHHFFKELTLWDCKPSALAAS